jgi:thiopurine S-methyltransferase
METDFWLERWSKNEIGFHQRKPNEYLTEYWSQLGVATQATVFVPLCGKSLDMRWLSEHAGHAVLGIEISANACRDFFVEWEVAPAITRAGAFEVYAARGVTLLCGDFFALDRRDVQGIAAVFDRAAMIALPPNMRIAYANKLRDILPSKTLMLLIAPEYAQDEMSGPPFSVADAEIRRLFADCEVDQLAELDVTNAPDNARFRQRGLTQLIERVYRIR